MIINDLDGYYIVFDTKNWNTELDTLFSRLKSLFYPSFCSNKKEKALKTISFSKLFPYLCLFLLRLRKNEVENYADDGGKTDAGNGEGTG